MNYVSMYGRLGNNLFELSAGMKYFGYDSNGNPNFTALTFEIRHGLLLRRMIKHINFMEFPIGNTGRLLGRNAYYQSPKWLVAPRRMRKYVDIITPEDVHDCIVHIRGDDYMQFPEHKASITTRPWILAAIKQLGFKPSDCVVCTDDPALASLLLPEAQNVSRSTKYDFGQMCHAKNLVMSASTFSWWAGYLGKARRIVFPRMWAKDYGSMEWDRTSVKNSLELMFDRCELVKE